MGEDKEMKILMEFGHLVIESNRFKDGFFCLHCSLFNPKIVFYHIQERLKK